MLLIVTAFILNSCEGLDAVSDDYQSKSSYTSEWEKKFSADGDYSVAHVTHDAVEPRVGKYQIWYPRAVSSSTDKWPAVVFANGSGVNASRYEPIFKHMASWGFIVIGNEDPSTWDGLTTILSLQHLLDLNAEKGNVLYGKLNTDAIGLAGHSQGGVSVFNAGTIYDLSHMFKALCAQSCVGHDLAMDMDWPYSPEEVSAPILLVAGTGDSDAKSISTLESLQKNFRAIKDQPVMIGRLRNIDHGDVLWRAEAYTAAWMLYWLCGDKDAEQCFKGSDAEMLRNRKWQDVEHKNL